jgi:hypothetical protein
LQVVDEVEDGLDRWKIYLDWEKVYLDVEDIPGEQGMSGKIEDAPGKTDVTKQVDDVPGQVENDGEEDEVERYPLVVGVVHNGVQSVVLVGVSNSLSGTQLLVS